MERGGLHVNTGLEGVFSKMPTISRICGGDRALAEEYMAGERGEANASPSESGAAFAQGDQQFGFGLWQLALAHDLIEIGAELHHLGGTAVEAAIRVLQG